MPIKIILYKTYKQSNIVDSTRSNVPCMPSNLGSNHYIFTWMIYKFFCLINAVQTCDDYIPVREMIYTGKVLIHKQAYSI